MAAVPAGPRAGASIATRTWAPRSHAGPRLGTDLREAIAVRAERRRPSRTSRVPRWEAFVDANVVASLQRTVPALAGTLGITGWYERCDAG